jgi:hypothetical protein
MKDAGLGHAGNERELEAVFASLTYCGGLNPPRVSRD